MKFKYILLLLGFALSLNGFGDTKLRQHDYDTIAKRLVKIKSTIPIEYNQYVQANITEFLNIESASTGVVLGKSIYIFPPIEKVLRQYKMPDELKYLAFALSGLNNRMVSEEGSSGMWLLKYYVAKSYGLKINSYIDERRDPIKSTEAACQYFEDLFKIYEDWNLCIAAFYSSPLEVNKAIRQSGGKLEYWKIHSYLPEEIQNIVPRFIASVYLFNHFRDHKIVAKAFTPILTDTVTIKNWTSFEQINKVMGIDLEMLREYNPIFKKGIIPYAKPMYFINIPASSLKTFRLKSDSIYVLQDKEPGLVTKPDEDGSDTTDDVKEEDKEEVKPQPKAQTGNAVLYYTVKRGDGLGKIAGKYDCKVSELKKWNNLRSDLIRPGQRLKVYVPKSKLSKYKKVR